MTYRTHPISPFSTSIRILAGATLPLCTFLSACTGNLVGGGTGGQAGGGGDGGTGGECPPGIIESDTCTPPPFCEAGTVEPCYGGPPGTLGVGTCQAGVHTCLPDGSAFGECEGDIPAPSDPCDPTSCQGSAVCQGYGLWSHSYESKTGQMGSSGMAIDAQGNVYITGYMAGEVDFGDGPVVVDTAYNGFLLKLDPNGNLLWKKRIGNDNVDAGVGDLAIDPAGNLLVLGAVSDGASLDIDGVSIEGIAGLDTFVLALDPNGNALWSSFYGGDGDELGYRLALGPSGEVVVTGRYYPLEPAPGPDTSGLFVWMLEPSGATRWERRIPMFASDFFGGVAFLPWGDVAIAGGFKWKADFGGDVLDGGYDQKIFAARFDGDDGSHQWSQQFGGEGISAEVIDLAAAQGGTLLITGRYQGPLDLGEGAFAGRYDEPFVAALNPAGGLIWSRALFSSENVGQGERLIPTPDDGVLLAGTFSSLTDISAGIAAGDLFIARFDSAGNPQGSRVYGGPISQFPSDILLDPTGNILLTGGFQGGIDLGSGPHQSAENRLDMFVAKIAP